jgi:hypothetical protein
VKRRFDFSPWRHFSGPHAWKLLLGMWMEEQLDHAMAAEVLVAVDQGQVDIFRLDGRLAAQLVSEIRKRNYL